jgi:prepilin-type N-terminal cleavage/methylation domain-containing protein
MRIRPKKSGGFTLLEIMIVVAIIGLLTALVAPHAMRARERACIETIQSNLRIIEDSKCIWAMERRVNTGTEPQVMDLVDYIKGQQLPQPVAGETYNINPVGVLASATLNQSLVDLPEGTELTLNSEN